MAFILIAMAVLAFLVLLIVPVVVSSLRTRNSHQKRTSKNTFAVIGYILGVFSLIMWLLPPAGLVFAILGIVFSALGISSSQNGLAVTGLIMSIFGFLLVVLNMAIGFGIGYALGSVL